MLARRGSGFGALCALLLIGAVACQGDEVPPTSAPTSQSEGDALSPEPSVTVSPSSSVTPSQSPRGNLPASPTEEPSPSASGTTNATPRPEAPLQGEGQQLGLKQIFSARGGWEQDRYRVADRFDVPGIAATLGTCGEDRVAELELRLENVYDRLTFQVSQENRSSSSTQTLVTDVIANGEERDTRSIPFNTTQPFDINVASVNALILRFYLVGECEFSGNEPLVTVVVEDLRAY